MTDGIVLGGRFSLGDFLGAGGTGAVYAATDRREPGMAAVKMLHPHLCATKAAREAFLREVSHLRRVNDPHVVRVRGAGVHDAAGVLTPWIAYDQLQGPSLASYVESNGPLTVPQARAVLTGVLAGLQASHAAGLLHRDVTPSNVILLADQELTADAVRLVDFGLAQSHEPSDGADGILLGEADADKVVGSPAYMSPEQIQGERLTAASDIYQAGALLYTALTGAVPFPRPTNAAMMAAHVQAPVPVPSALAPGSASLDAVVARAMAKAPIARFGSAAQMADAIAASRSGSRLATRTLVEQAATPTQVVPRLPEARPLPPTPSAVSRPTYLEPATIRPAPATTMASGGSPWPLILVLTALMAGMVALASQQPAPAAHAPTTPTTTASVAPASTHRAAHAPVTTVARSTPSSTPTDTTAATVSAPASPSAREVTVPDLSGSLADVEAALRQAGLRIGTITREDGPATTDTLVRQLTASGTVVAPNTAINVVVASGWNTIPSVAGQDVAGAIERLQAAGFQVTVAPDARSDDEVIGCLPRTGTRARVEQKVRLTTAAPRTASPSATPTDTPTPQASPTTPTPSPTPTPEPQVTP